VPATKLEAAHVEGRDSAGHREGRELDRQRNLAEEPSDEERRRGQQAGDGDQVSRATGPVKNCAHQGRGENARSQ
jgi:hypothetical protein